MQSGQEQKRMRSPITVCGNRIESPDTFHKIVFIDELNRVGTSSLYGGLLIAICAGLPPVIALGNSMLQEKVVLPCLRGEKLICLAITEPWAGSDVSNIRASAVKSDCGKYYIVNGIKKWITNGYLSDFFTTAVVTGI